MFKSIKNLFQENIPKSPAQTKTKIGAKAEDCAAIFLKNAGLEIIEKNFKTKGRGGGEIDLIAQDKNGTIIFIEVRFRKNKSRGGALASIDQAKQKRIIFAAQNYISKYKTPPKCRFDAVSFDEEINEDNLKWIKGAFYAQ